MVRSVYTVRWCKYCDRIHTAVYLTKGPQPLAKPVLHSVWSSASSFNLHYPLFSFAAVLVGRSRDRFPVMSLDSSVTYSFRPRHGPDDDSAPSENEYQEHFLEVKTAGAWGWQPHHLHVPNVMEIWEPITSWNPVGHTGPVTGLFYLFSLRPSNSCLCLLPRLPVTFILTSISPSVTCFRRQFLRKLWPIQLALLFTIRRMYIPSLTLNTSSFLTRSFQLISFLLRSNISKLSRYYRTAPRSVQVLAQQKPLLQL